MGEKRNRNGKDANSQHRKKVCLSAHELEFFKY